MPHSFVLFIFSHLFIDMTPVSGNAATALDWLLSELSKTTELLGNTTAVFPNKVTLLGNTARQYAKNESDFGNVLIYLRLLFGIVGDMSLDDLG